MEKLNYYRKLTNLELLEVFKKLDAPNLTELDGEYKTILPFHRQENMEEYFLKARNSKWLGKAYLGEVYDGYDGQGYNMWEKEGKIERFSRFVWNIEKSKIDNKQSLIMYYGYFNFTGRETGLIDEVRKLGEGIYLGLYYTKKVIPTFSEKWDEINNRTFPEYFFLYGNSEKWQGVDDEGLEI